MTDPKPKIVLYEDGDFGGASREFTSDIADLNSAGFSDRASSIKVFSSVWVAYEHGSFEGRQYLLEEGSYPKWSDVFGNDQITSLKMLNPDSLGLTPSIVLYEDGDFQGKQVAFEYAIEDLEYYQFNDKASSIKVKTGIWVLFEHGRFEGRQYILEEGEYPNWSEAFANDQITSLRPVKEPAFTTEILSMTYDMAAGMLNTTPVAHVNLSQSNDTSVEQTASWSTTKSVTTSRTYEWRWDNSTTIGGSYTMSIGVPIIANGEMTMGAENTYNVGSSSSEENTQQDEWKFELPSKVAPHTRLTVQVSIQEGKMDVPFKAVVQRGSKVWEEQGTYYGVQSFNLVVDYTETAL